MVVLHVILSPLEPLGAAPGGRLWVLEPAAAPTTAKAPRLMLLPDGAQLSATSNAFRMSSWSGRGLGVAEDEQMVDSLDSTCCSRGCAFGTGAGIRGIGPVGRLPMESGRLGRIA